MKYLSILLLLAVTLLMFACKDDNGKSEGILRIMNNTNGIAMVSLPGVTDFAIGSHGFHDFTIETGKSLTGPERTMVTVTVSGSYLSNQTRYVPVFSHLTTTEELSADCGVVTLHNNTNGEARVTFVGGDEVTIPASNSIDYKVYTGSSSGNKTFTVDGTYIVEDNREVMVTRDGNVEQTLTADSGAIQITNNSTFPIEHIYISPSDDIFWGADLIPTALVPGHYALFYQLVPDSYDVKVVDSQDNVSIIYNNVVTANNTLSFSYEGGKKASEVNDRKLPGGSTNYHWESKVLPVQ